MSSQDYYNQASRGGEGGYPQQHQSDMSNNYQQRPGEYQGQQQSNYQGMQGDSRAQGQGQNQGYQQEQGGYQNQHSTAQQHGQTNGGGAAAAPEEEDTITKWLVKLEKKFGGDRFTNPDNAEKNKAFNENVIKKLTYGMKLVMQRAPGMAMKYLR